MTVKASDIKITITAEDTAKEEIDKLLESGIIARTASTVGKVLHGGTLRPGMPPPLHHTYVKNGRVVVEVDAIYVAGEGYVYI